MADLDPVEIEINLTQNVSGEADKAAAGIENLSTVSKASLEKLEKDFADQVEIIKNMQYVIDELQKKIAGGTGDVISPESVARLTEAQEVLTDVSNTITAYQENMSAMTEANQQGADITQVFTEANQTLSESQTELRDTMVSVLDTYNELNEAEQQSADSSAAMTQSSQEATEAQGGVTDTISGMIDAYSELGEEQEDNTNNTDDNTETLEHNTAANRIMSATIKGLCNALGIENTAVVNAISNTRTITAVKGAWTRATQLLNTQLGISIGMSKALVASGIGLILVAVAAAVVAYRAWTQEDRILEKAQESVNQTLEESAQKKRDLEGKTNDYISVINSETKAINDQIAAYRQLQGLHPKTLENIDLQTFKLMGATQQQKLLNEAISQQSNQSQDEYLDSLKEIERTATQSYSKGIFGLSGYLKKRGEIKEALGYSTFEGLLTADNESFKILSKKIEILEQEKKIRGEITKEAEFQLKPESERRAILEAQLESLQTQKTALDTNSGASAGFNKQTANGSLILQGVKDQANQVTGSVNKWGEQPDALSNIFSNASLQASILDVQIAGIQGQLNTLNGIGSSAVVKNEEYWAKRKKESEQYIKSLDSSVLSVLESGAGYAAIDPSIVSGYQKAIKGITDAEKELTTYQISAQEGTKAFYEQKQKRAQALLDSMTDLDKGSDKWKAAVKEYNNTTEKLKLWDIKGQNKDGSKAAKEAEKLKEKQLKATEDLAKKSLDIQAKIDASRVAAMEDGAQKQRAALKAEYDKEKALIKQELKEIEDIEKITGKPATQQRAQVGQLDIALDKQFLAENEKLSQESAKQIQAIFDDVNQKFRGELDNNLFEINKYYDEQIKEAHKYANDLKKVGIADKMLKAFGGGNVDLLTRPLVDAAKLVSKGWEVAAEDIATVYSSQYGITNKDGKETEILITPILPDGTILSKDELESYVDEVLSGNNIIEADNLGIVIAVDVDPEGTAGETLHQLQEEYYQLSEESETTTGLNLLRENEIAQVRRQNQLKNLAFETDIAIRRLALSKNFYVFESDRLKKHLELQKKAKEEELKILEQQYKETPTPELANKVTDATLAIAEMEKGIKKLSAQKFQEIAGFVTQISGGLSDLFGADSSAGKALGWATDFGEAGAKIASGDPKAMIEGTLQAAGTIKDIIATNAQANREIREFAYELEQAALNYSIAIIAALKDLKSANDSLFYADTSNTLLQGMEGYNAAVQKEIDLVSKLGDTTVQVGKKKKKFMGITTGTKAIWEDVLTGYKKVLDTDDELIDKNGQVNKQIAESLLNSGKLSKEATNLINQILDAQDAAASAMAQVESTLESLAGSIGDDLKTALMDAFQDGGAIGAAEKFKESVSKTLEDIVTDKMFSAIYGEMLGELEDRMKNSYGSGGDQDLVDDIMWFYKQSQDGANAFYDQLAKAKEELKAQGFEIASTEREGASKGIATASQDSITELNGGVYALRQSVNTLVNLEKESLLIQKTHSVALDQIAKNSEHLKLLPAIKGALEDINSKGVTLR